jgi:hypothetical protein
MGKLPISGFFLKLLGYQLSQRSSDTQKKIQFFFSQKIEQKKKKPNKSWRPREKMCLLGVIWMFWLLNWI